MLKREQVISLKRVGIVCVFRCQGLCTGVNTIDLPWQVSKCGTHLSLQQISIFTRVCVFINNCYLVFADVEKKTP